MGDSNVIVIGSDEEDEKALWKTNGTDDHFQRLFKKVKRIIFNQTKRSYISNGFPYGRFIEYAQELETALATVPSKNTQRFIWRCVVRWLVPLKNCIREPTPLSDDWTYNYIVTDIMTQYINFKCEYYHERDEAVVKEQIEEIIRMLEVAFSCKTEFVLITFLKIKIRYEYRNILIPLFRAYLIAPFDYDANDFCKYICLVLCYRQWKRLIRTKESRETVNEYACGQSERLMGTYRAIDLTLNPVLPWEVPNATRRSELFFKLHPHLTTAREMKNGTRLLLASVWRDWSFILRKFIRLYEEYNGFSVRLEPEVPSVKLRDVDLNSDDDVILIPNDDVIVIADDDDLPSADGSISNMNHLKVVETLRRLAEDTPPKSLEEQENTEKALQNLRCRCATGTQGTTMAVNQHLSKVCDISSLSKALGFSSLRSLSIQISVYLSIFKNEKAGSCSCKYLGSSFNENNVCIVLDTTDADCDDDENYFVRDEVTDKIGDDITINDLVDRDFFGKNAEITKQPPAAVASVIAELKRRALDMGSQIQNRRPETPIVLSSDDDEPLVVEPPAAVQGDHQNNVIIAEIVLSSSEDEAPAPERENVSPRLSPPPMDVEERPLRREKSRCITGEVSSTTSLDCSSTRNEDNVSIQNDNVLENAREVGTLSVVRTSSPIGNDLSIADYSDISDDDLDICLAPRQRWGKFPKVVEEATSSTSELPVRDESEARSDNVIFSVPCDRRRRSNSSSPCHRANSPSDNSRLISPSSTFRSRRIKRYRARHFSRIPVRKFRTVTRASDDSDLPTCSRYLRRIPKHQNGGLENCKNSSDLNEKASCSRNVQKKKPIVQNGEGAKENPDLKSTGEKLPEAVGQNVNASSGKEVDQRPPASENVNSDLNKLVEDITKFIDSPVHSKVKTYCCSPKSTDKGREQANVISKETEASLALHIVPHSKGDVQLELGEEVSTDVVVERSTMTTSPDACSSKHPVSEHSYSSKANKSDQGSEENEREEKSALSLTENMEHNKSQCSISARDHERMFATNGKLFSNDSDDLAYLRDERTDRFERSPLSSVENDFLVEDELSSYELDQDDDIESPAYEPIIPKTLDKATVELALEGNKTAEDEIRPSKTPDLTVCNESTENNDVLNDVRVKDSSDCSKEKHRDGNSKLSLENTEEDLVKQSEAINKDRSIAISENDLVSTRVGEQMHDLSSDKPLHSSHSTMMTTKSPLDPIESAADLDDAVPENVIAAESAANDDGMCNDLVQRNEAVLEISSTLPVPPSNLCSIGDTDARSMPKPNVDIAVVCELDINEIQVKATQSSLSKDNKAIQTVAFNSNFENSPESPSNDRSNVPTVDLSQSKSDDGVGKTNEHENKSVSEAVAKSSEILNESGAEEEAHAKSKASPEKSANTLSASASAEVSTQESEGACANLSNKESVSADAGIPSLDEKSADKEEQKETNEISNIFMDPSPPECPAKDESTSLSDVGIAGPTDLLSSKGPAGLDHTSYVLENQRCCHMSASSEKEEDALSTSLETDHQIRGEEQKHSNLNESSNEPTVDNANRPVSSAVAEDKLQEKCDDNNLTEATTIIDGSVESLSSLSAIDSTPSSAICKALLTEHQSAPRQDADSKKPATTEVKNVVPAAAVLDENKGEGEIHGDEEHCSADKSEVDEVAANETAPTGGETEAEKQSLLIQESDEMQSDVIENVETLPTSEQKMISQERTPISNCDVSEEQGTHMTDISADVGISTKEGLEQTPEDETHPLEHNETSPPQDSNTETKVGHQERFKTEMSSADDPQVIISLNVSTESENSAVLPAEKVNVETEVAPEMPAVSEYPPSCQANDTLLGNEIQSGSDVTQPSNQIESAVPLADHKHQDLPQNISNEVIEDHTVPKPSESHDIAAESSLSSEKVLSEEECVSESIHREAVQSSANASENSSSAELTVASQGSDAKDLSNESIQNTVDQTPAPASSVVLSHEEDTASDKDEDTTKNDAPAMDCLSKDQSENVSENIPDTSPDNKPAEDRSRAASKESIDCVAVARQIEPQTSTEANLDVASEVQLDCGKSGLPQPPRVDHVQMQTNEEFLSRSPVTNPVRDPIESSAKELIPQTDSTLSSGGLQNQFTAEDLSTNGETKCYNIQEAPSTHDHATQDQGKRNVIRAAKQLLSIEDYAMVKSFPKVAPPFAEPCNAHVTTVTQTHNLVDEIQTSPQNERHVLGARQEQNKYNTPADYSTTSPTVVFSNPIATRDSSRYKKKQCPKKAAAKLVNSSEKRRPVCCEAELSKPHHSKNKPRPISGINIERNLEANRSILSLTQQLRNLPFAAIARPSDTLNVMKVKLMESKRPPSDIPHFDPRNVSPCMPPGSVLCPENRFQLYTDRCCAPKMIPSGSAYPNMAFRGHEPPYKPSNLALPSAPFVNPRTERDNFRNFTWPTALAGISKSRQMQLCQPKPLEVIPCNKFSPYFVPERRCAPLLQGVLEDSTYRTHMSKIFERMSASVPEPVAKKLSAPDSYPCIDYSKQNDSLRKSARDDVPINRNESEGLSSPGKEMRADSGADLKSEGNGPSFNTWSNEAEIQFLLKLQQTRSLYTGDDSNQSTQVEVAAEDLGDPLSSLDSGTGYNSPAYGCETPYGENSTDCSSNAVTQPNEDLEDQEVSTITSQEVPPTTYAPYNDDCGTPVMDEKDAEDAEGSPCQGKIVSLSVLKQIPELPSLPSVPTQTLVNQVNKFPEDTPANCCSVIRCPDASKNFIPIDMTSTPKDTGSGCENRPVNSNPEFIEPSPKPKPAIDIDSEYQKTPLKMRIKRRISQCADINEAFNLGPSASLKPIDILATQALERQHNECVSESGVDSASQTPVSSICNYPTDLSLKASDTTPEQEKDQNLLYQESWYKKLGKTKAIDKTPHQQQPTPVAMSSSQCTSDNSDAMAMLQLSGSHLNATSIASIDDTPVSAKNEGRRRKPVRVRKLADIYDRDNVTNEADMPASVYPTQQTVHPTQSASHSLFTYPGVVQAVETAVPLQPISVLETAYNPEDIKAATILSDMLKTSYKIDESLKYRSPKTPKTRKTTSPRSNKQASLQFRRMTRSTSHLMDKSPFIDTTNTLQLILPTTSEQLPCAQDSPHVAENPCANSIWQQDKTKEILRSLTVQTSRETDKAIPFQSNSSSDSDDVGKLVIDMDHTRGAAAVDQHASEAPTASLPSTGEILDMTNVYLTKGTVKRNSNSVHKLTPGYGFSPRLQRHSVDKSEFELPNSPEYDVSALYPIVQLTEITPKTRSKRGPRKTTQPRSYVRQNGRRILNSPKPSAEKKTTKVPRTAKPKKSPKTKGDTANGRQTVTEAKTAGPVLQSESPSELSTSDNSPPETPDKILPFSVDAILRGCKSSGQKPAPPIESPPTPPEMATSSQEYWLKAFLLMRKSSEEVSSEPKEKPVQAPSLSVQDPVDGASETATVPELTAATRQTAATSADKAHRRKTSLLPTKKVPKSLTDTEVCKSEEDGSAAPEKAKNVQSKVNRKKYNRTAKPIISAEDALESEQATQTDQIEQKSPPETEITNEPAVAEEAESGARKITPTALNNPTPTAVNPLLVCQKIRKSKSVEDIVARLSKTVRKSKLRLSIEPELDETTPARSQGSQQGPKQPEDVLNYEGLPSLKVSLQLSAIAGENKTCEKPEPRIECNGQKQKRGRRKSEKKQSLEAIAEDKMETQLNEMRQAQSMENDSSEIPAITVEADRPRSRRRSAKELEGKDVASKQPDQCEETSTAEQASPAVADKPKRRRSSNKKVENKPVESNEEEKSDGKPATKHKAKSDEENEINASKQKETKPPQGEGPVEQVEDGSSEITAIQATPVEGEKSKTRRKLVKEPETPGFDCKQPDQSSTPEPASPVVADKPKRRRSSNKKIESKPIQSNEEDTSAGMSVTENKENESQANSDCDQKEAELRKDEQTTGRDEPVENDSSEITATTAEADPPRNLRKPVEETESKDADSKQLDQCENTSSAEQASPVVADKPKRRRSSNKKIENKPVEINQKEEDTSGGKSLTTGQNEKASVCQSAEEQIENSDSGQKETYSPKEEEMWDESVENDSPEKTAIQSESVEADRPRNRRKSHKELESKDIASKQPDPSENSSITEPGSAAVADKPKRRRSSNKIIENKAIESKEDKSDGKSMPTALANDHNKAKLNHSSDEQTETSDGDEKETESPKEEQTPRRDEPADNDSRETTAIQPTSVEADKSRNRRKSHEELECNDTDSLQLENSSITEPTSAAVADKPKRRRGSNKKIENKPSESREEDKSLTAALAANKNTTELCHESDEKAENSESDSDRNGTRSRKEEMAQLPQDPNDKQKTTTPESNKAPLSEITAVESIEVPPSPVVVDKTDKSMRNPYEVCKSTAMSNVEVEKCHLKRKCIMEIRRLSIDENNLKMTLSKSKEIVEKHSKHAKKHSKRARRLSAEICDIIRRNEETERRIKAHGGQCNDDKGFKVMKLKRTEDTESTGKSLSPSVDDVMACETASAAESNADPLPGETAAVESEIDNSTDDCDTNVDASKEEGQVEAEIQKKEAVSVPQEGNDKPRQAESKPNGVKKVKSPTDAPVEELSLKVDELNKKPSKDSKSVKSRKRPAPRSQKAKQKSKRRRVDEVMSSESEEDEMVASIEDTSSAAFSPDADNTLGVFKIVRSTVAQRHKPAPKSRKRLNSQHTTDRKRLVVLLRRTKPVKRAPEEEVKVHTALPKENKSSKIVQRRSLDCDSSRANSETSLRLRSKSTDMKRSPSSDQPSRKLKPFKLNISKLEACHKTLKEMNSTEPTTSYEAKLYDESERLAEQLNSFIKKILEDSEDSSSMLLTSRPQIFDRVPKDIFAGNGDVSDNIGAKYYSPILPPKPYEIILKSKPSEEGNLKAKAVEEQEKIKPRGDADDQEAENEDAENGNNSDGNSAPDLELDASEMPHIPDVGIICDEDSIPDLCAEAECLSEVLDEKINKEILDASIDTSTPFIRDYMISGNYRSNNYLDLPLLPEFEGISLLGVQNQFQNDNSDGDGLLVPKVENLADVEIDFGSELFLYSGCIQSQDSSGSSDEKREQECETPTPPVDAYLNATHPIETVSETTPNEGDIVNEVVTEEVIQDTSIPQNQPPPVEVSSEVGFESYNELLAESNPFFLPPVQSNERSTSESQPDEEAASQNTAEDIVEKSTAETRDKEPESFPADSGNLTPVDKEVARDSVVDTKELPAKTKRDRIKVLPIESLKPETREEMCAPVKLKSRPIPFWKIKKIETKSTPDSVAQASANSVKEMTTHDTPPASASPVVPEFSTDVAQPAERVVPAQSCEDTSTIDEAPSPSDNPPKDNAEGVIEDVSTECKAAQLIEISQLPELSEAVEDTTSAKNMPTQSTHTSQLPELNDAVEDEKKFATALPCNSSQDKHKDSTQIPQLPELNATVENRNKLDSSQAGNSSEDKYRESTQISQLPDLNEIANNRPDFDHTYTSTPKMKVHSMKLPELNEVPENHSNATTKPPINTVQKLPESSRITGDKHKPDTKHSCQNPSKKIRSSTPSKLSIDDLFDRLKRESPVNPLMHKMKYALQKTASFDTDDNSSRDSCVGLLTLPEAPHPAIPNAPSPAAFACASPLPIAPSMPIISTPSRHDSGPDSSANSSYPAKSSKPLLTSKGSPALDPHSKESGATYVAPSTSKDLKRPHGKVDIAAPEGPPKKIAIKATDSTPCVEKLENKSHNKTHKTDKSLERLKKPSSLTTTPASSPRPDMKPNQRVHFSSEIIEIPKVDLLLSASKAKTESPRPTPKPMKSILVSPCKHSGSHSSDSSTSRWGRYRISENKSLDHSSPMSDGYATSSHSQRVNSLKVSSKSSPHQSSRADKTSHSSRSFNSADITENNRNRKLPNTPSTHSRSSSSAETEKLIASLTAEIESISNTLKRLPEPNIYAQHNYRKHTREMYEQKLQHLHELKKRRYKETERHSQAQLRSKSYSERQPFDNSSDYKTSVQSSQRETKEKSKDSRRPYVNKFGELGTKHFPIVDTYESRVGNCREAKRLPSWDLKQISADEIIADLKMKKSRRN